MLRWSTAKVFSLRCHPLPRSEPEPLFWLLQKHLKSKSIALCKEIHASLLKSHSDHLCHVSNTLLTFYLKCGDFSSAHHLFDHMPHKNVVTWTSLISSYIRQGDAEKALNLFKEMLHQNQNPNAYTFSTLLRACTSCSLIELGRQVHGLILKHGLSQHEYTGSGLVDFYKKVTCDLSDASCVFRRLSARDLVTWNVIISGFAQSGDTSKVLSLYAEMREVDELIPNDFTITSLLKCCVSIEDVEKVHCLALRYGFEGDIVVGSALVEVYGKYGDLFSGNKIFYSMEVKDAFAWSSIVTCHIRAGLGKQAVVLFKEMLSQGAGPDQHILSGTLRACVEIGILETGIQMHTQTIKNGYQKDCFVNTGLINLYAATNGISVVEKLFRSLDNRDIVVWNTMISCYAELEEEGASSYLCISLLRELLTLTYILSPDVATFVTVMSSCRSVSDFPIGIQIHCLMIKNSQICQAHRTTIGNALIRMYSNFKDIESAQKAFNAILHKDEVSWSSLIGAYQQNGFDFIVLKIFKEMLENGIPLTNCSLPLAVTACGKISAIDIGKQIHCLVCKLGFNKDIFVGSSVVDMYAKCGNMEGSERAYEENGEPNEVLFNSLISGFAKDGNAIKAVKLFHEMVKMRLIPNHITFLSVLSACSHAGLVEESLFFFKLMNQRYHVKPEAEHFGSLIDVLGRVGRLEEAYEMVENGGGCVFAWKTLMNACRNYENVKTAEKCAQRVVEIDPNDPSPYILLSNMYSREGRWEDASKLRQKMVEIGMKKNEAGSSWLMM